MILPLDHLDNHLPHNFGDHSHVHCEGGTKPEMQELEARGDAICTKSSPQLKSRTVVGKLGLHVARGSKYDPTT